MRTALSRMAREECRRTKRQSLFWCGPVGRPRRQETSSGAVSPTCPSEPGSETSACARVRRHPREDGVAATVAYGTSKGQKRLREGQSTITKRGGPAT
jgi:hypothetical protein